MQQFRNTEIGCDTIALVLKLNKGIIVNNLHTKNNVNRQHGSKAMA